MRNPTARALAVLAAAAMLAGAGCAHIPFLNKKAPTEARLNDSGLTMSTLQIEVLRVADDYVNSVAKAADSAAKKLGTREADVAALKWKIEQGTAAYADATGENPVWNALDLTVLATVARMTLEQPRLQREFGGAAEKLVAAHRQLEANAWALVGTFLTPEQMDELRDLITKWRAKNPDETDASGARFREFALNLGQTPQSAKNRPSSIFSMLYLDPFAGLDPTTVAIDQSRELAERVVAYAERAPTLMRWQAELLALQVAQQPAALGVTADLERTSKAIESIATTAQGVPELVDVQRKAAIDQIFVGVAQEREAILRELDAREATIQTLLGQLRETMNAGGNMGNSLNGMIQSLDAFVHYVSPPPVPGASPAAPGKPFNPLEYGQAASQVGSMARDLNALLHSAEGTAPALAKASASAGDDMKRVVDHAFWRGLVLILVLLLGSIPVRLAYRALDRRFGRTRAGSPGEA